MRCECPNPERHENIDDVIPYEAYYYLSHWNNSLYFMPSYFIMKKSCIEEGVEEIVEEYEDFALTKYLPDFQGDEDV